jgi:hypothetical protein
MWRTLKALSPLFALALVGCASTDDEGNASFHDYLTGLPGWTQPAPPQEVRSDLGTTYRTLAQDWFECRGERIAMTRAFDTVQWLGGEDPALVPGMLLQGGAYEQGLVRGVSLPRAPVALKIDLPVERHTIVVDEPTALSLAEAVAELQAEGDRLPDQAMGIYYRVVPLTAPEQLATALHMPAVYADRLYTAGLDDAISRVAGLTEHTVLVQIVQPQYAIRFTDATSGRAIDLFADDLEDAEWREQVALGAIGPDNLPVVIGNVTYGRMLVFTMTSRDVADARELRKAVDAAVREYYLPGTGGVEYRMLFARAELRVLAIGMSGEAAAAILPSGDLGLLFAHTTASAAVPVSFVAHAVTGDRDVARLGDEAVVVEPHCLRMLSAKFVPLTKRGLVFTSLGVAAGRVWMTDEMARLYRYDIAAGTLHRVPLAIPIEQVSAGVRGVLGLRTTTPDGDSVMLLSTDGGETLDWLPGHAAWLDVYDDKTMAIVGQDGIVARFDGMDFVPTDFEATRVAIGADGTMYAATASGFWRCAGTPCDFVRIPFPPAPPIVAKDVVLAATHVSVGATGEMWGTTVDGRVWRYAGNELHEMWSFAPDALLIEVGNDGRPWKIDHHGVVHRLVGPLYMAAPLPPL